MNAILKLSIKQEEQLNSMTIGKWYNDFEMGNGKILRVLVNKGLIEFKQIETILFGEQYTPCKYGKQFKRVK